MVTTRILQQKCKTYPLVNIQKAIENGPVEIVDLPIKHGDFSIVMLVYQRGYISHIGWFMTFCWHHKFATYLPTSSPYLRFVSYRFQMAILLDAIGVDRKFTTEQSCVL